MVRVSNGPDLVWLLIEAVIDCSSVSCSTRTTSAIHRLLSSVVWGCHIATCLIQMSCNSLQHTHYNMHTATHCNSEGLAIFCSVSHCQMPHSSELLDSFITQLATTTLHHVHTHTHTHTLTRIHKHAHTHVHTPELPTISYCARKMWGKWLADIFDMNILFIRVTRHTEI